MRKWYFSKDLKGLTEEPCCDLKEELSSRGQLNTTTLGTEGQLADGEKPGGQCG